MKKINLSIFWLLIFIGAKTQNSGHYLIVGTYTSGKSEGIYVFRFNPENAESVSVSKATGIKNPSFLTVSPDNRFIYSVEELNGTGNSGKVVAYTFNQQDGRLNKINDQPSGGDDPCYITIDKTGKWVIVGNYSSGSLAVLPVNNDGSLGKPTSIIVHKGSSVNKDRQEKPHVHATVLSADNRFLFVPDLGTDRVMVYAFNTKTGKLTTAKKPFASARPGSGPRHFEFHPSGKYAYLMEELTGTVTAFTYDAAAGALKAFQTISSLPSDYKGPIGSADIHVSPDGKFVYASNRGESNTLAIYAVDPATGKLTYMAHQSTLGKIPRNFNLDPSGNYLLVANQNSDEIVIFKRDIETGLLTDTGKRVAVPTPVCLKWIGK